MSTLRQAAQQALEALERYRVETPLGHQPHMIAEQADIAITALKQALAEHEPLGWITAGQHTAPLKTHWEGCEEVHPECRKPEQEPVCAHGVGKTKCGFCKQPEQNPLATWENKYGMKEWEVHAIRAGWMPAPTPRNPLSDEQIALIVGECAASAYRHDDFSFARAIERAHGIGDSK